MKIGSNTAMIEIKDKVRKINVWELGEGNEPFAPTIVVWFVCIYIPAITGPSNHLR